MKQIKQEIIHNIKFSQFEYLKSKLTTNSDKSPIQRENLQVELESIEESEE